LSEKETYLSYYSVDKSDEFYRTNALLFQEAYNRYKKKNMRLALSASTSIQFMANNDCENRPNERCSDIEGVTIINPRPIHTPNMGLYLPPRDPDSTDNDGIPRSGCGSYGDCGGGGGGTGTGTPQQDACSKAKIASVTANNITQDLQVKEKALDPLNKIRTDKVEHGIGVGRNSNRNITVSPISTGVADQTTVQAPDGDYVFNAHTHPSGTDTPHSGPDLYNALENIAKSSSFEGTLVINSSGTTYGIFVNDRNAVIEFLKKYPKEGNLGSKEFNTSNDIGKDYNAIRDSFSSGRSPSNGLAEQTAGMEAALSYVIQKYNMGVSILKADKNGNFKGITAKAEKVYDPVNKEYKDGYSSNLCN
ncbi:hypothetical protein M2T82_18525, partial [Elizabethkingia ursingii]|nr:hypothetical protein [Elizabethkingia ursingii]